MSETGTPPAAATPWSAPAIDGSSGSGGFMTAEDLQALQKQAYDEAYEEGLRAGEAAGAGAIVERVSRLDALLSSLAEPLADTDDAVIEQLVQLAATVVRHLFRREIDIEPGHVIGVVRQALELLPVASRDVRVMLHPDDARIVEASLTPTDGERAWTAVEDPLISRGGCQIVTASSRIDATVESRLNSLVGQLLGSRRDES